MNGKNLKKPSKGEWAEFDALKDEDIDTSDIPSLGDDFFKNAVLRLPRKKDRITMLMDHDILEWFKAQGRGYQTRINALLRAFMDARKKAQA